MTTDVIVIGGGIAGVSVAYELAADRSVLLLEAEPRLAHHATARSAATYIPGHGTGAVRTLIAASGPRFRALAAELDAPPLLQPRPVLWIATDGPGERVLAERASEPNAPTRIDAAEAERRCPALAPGRVRAAGLTVGAADIDTDALHQAYVRGLRSRDGRVRSAARVTALDRDGGGWRVHAGSEVHTAGGIVDAAGAWADEVAALAGVPRLGVTPLRRTIALARVPDPARLRAPGRGRLPMVIEAAERFYFKTEGEDLLVSPGDETPVRPGDAKPDAVDVATALERVEAVTALGLRSVRTSWAGLRTFVADRRPVVGAWPGHPGFWFLAAQGGSGIEAAPALAAFASAMIEGRPVPTDVTVDPSVLAPVRLRAGT